MNTQDFVLLKIIPSYPGYQVSSFVGGIRLVHLDVILFGVESPVGQQTFINTAQLVDAQIGIADPAAWPTALLFGKREPANNILPHLVTEFHLVEVVQFLVVEKWRVDVPDFEAFVVPIFVFAVAGT